MAILFSDQSYRSAAIFAALRKIVPADIDLRCYPDIGDPDDIDYAIIWYPAAGSLQNLPNLKAIFTTSAGVDGIIHDPTLPENVPIIRNTDPSLARGVSEYVAYQVLRFYRKHHIFDAQQRQQIWKQQPQPTPQDYPVGIMGMGTIGRKIAHHLRAFDFPLSAWSQSRKQIEGVTSFAGDDELQAFLSTSKILINILPLTSKTEHILNRTLFDMLPKGAYLINVGRGKHLVQQDLLTALDSGQIAAAAMDVFETEPLPQHHPFWTHPKITLTPHIASITNLEVNIANILQQIEQHQKGIGFKEIVDRSKQY